MVEMTIGRVISVLLVGFVILLVRFQIESNHAAKLGNVQPDDAFKRRFEAEMKAAYRDAATRPVETHSLEDGGLPQQPP